MLKKLLVSLFLCLSPAYGALQSDRFFDNTGGLVDRYSPILVPVKSASDIQNVHLDERGQLIKRPGYDKNNTTDMTRSTVTGGGYHQSTAGTSFMAVVVGTNVWTTGNTFGGGYTNVTGTTTLTASIDNLAQFTSFNDWGVICNNSDAPIQLTATLSYRIPNVSTGAKTCESFNSYLLLGNTLEDTSMFGSRLRWSDINTLNTWPANNYRDIEPSDGDSIVVIKRYQQSLFVFKKHSIYEVIQTGGLGAEAFIVRPIARGIGAWAKNSVKVIENRGIVFLGQNGVYLFDGSNFEFISDPIQRTIDGLNRTRFPYAVAEVYPPKNQYWISVANGGNTSNQTILVWDYIQQAWSVYSGIQANALIKAEDNNGNVRLFHGDYNGNTYLQDTGVSDEPNGVTTGITAFYATSNLYFGAPEISKTFKYLYLFSKATTSSTITVDIAYDYNDTYVDSKTVNIGETGSVWGTAVWGTDVWPGSSTKVDRIELNRSGRAVRFKYIDSSDTTLGILGWAVVYQNEDYKDTN